MLIPGSRALYGTATVLDGELADCVDALGIIDGVKVRHPQPKLGLVTFEYAPQQAQV